MLIMSSLKWTETEQTYSVLTLRRLWRFLLYSPHGMDAPARYCFIRQVLALLWLTLTLIFRC